MKLSVLMDYLLGVQAPGILTSPASDRDIRPGIVCGQVRHLEAPIVGHRLNMRDESCPVTAGERSTRLAASAASTRP